MAGVGSVLLICVLVGLKVAARTVGRNLSRQSWSSDSDPPPGDPICRVLPAPQDCHYLYYVLSDTEGHHAFAATLEQHEENIRQARADGVLS